MNEENLKKLGYYNIALEMLLKREAQINTGDIEVLLPGEYQPVNNNNVPDDQAVEITLENIEQQFKILVNTIKSLPDTHNDDDYFGKLKRNLLHEAFDVGLKISSLLTEAGMNTDEIDKYNNEM